MFQIKAVYLNEIFVLCASSVRELLNLDLNLDSAVKWIRKWTTGIIFLAGEKIFLSVTMSRLTLGSSQPGYQGPSLEQGNAATV
jgi:hypothetical protein